MAFGRAGLERARPAPAGRFFLASMGSDLKHLWQIRALCTAPVTPTACRLLWAVRCDLIQPIHDLAVTTMVVDQPLHLIATGTAALVARHPKHFELASEIAEYEGTVAGDHTSPDGLIVGSEMLVQ